MDKTRLSLELPPVAKVNLDWLVTHTEAQSKIEVIRHALAVYAGVIECQENGGTIVYRSAEGVEKQIKFV